MAREEKTAPDGKKFILDIPDDYLGARDIRWPADFNLRQGGDCALRGKPHPLNPKRCQAARRRIVPKIQCPCWAMRGSNFCQYHGRKRSRKTTWRRPSPREGILARYYSRRAGPALAQKLAELAAGDTSKMRHSLAEEIDLARVMAEKAVTRFERIVLDPKPNKKGELPSGELKSLCTHSLRDALKFVSDTVEKSARVKALDSSVVEAEHIEYVANEIARIINHHLPQDTELAVRIVEDVQKITFPNSGNIGVNPKEAAKMIRALVKDMDASVVGE